MIFIMPFIGFSGFLMYDFNAKKDKATITAFKNAAR